MKHDEVMSWRKSSYSNAGDPDNCVEVGTSPRVVAIRDTKDRRGGTLAVTPEVWTAFVSRISC